MSVKFQPYKHEPIRKDSDDIRLIRLLSPDTIEIFQASLQNPPEYRALSYVWGTKDSQKLLKVSDSKHGLRHMKIRENCMQAISRLYQDDSKVPVWIDAICIDQSNVLERNHQVQRMGQIYSYAEKVQIFLGGASDPKNRPWLKMLDVFARHTGLFLEPLKENLQTLQNLLDLPYFTRRWVLQEVYCARDAEILGFYEVLSWRRFLRYNRYIYRLRLHRDIDLMDLQNRWTKVQTAIANFAPGVSFVSGSSLVNYLDRTLELDSSEELDIVYALLGILDRNNHIAKQKLPEPQSTWIQSWIQPDYRKSVAELKSEILENDWEALWKWLNFDSWYYGCMERESGAKPTYEALRDVLDLADRHHHIMANISLAWWWIYGPKLEELAKESTDLAMKIRVTFPYASEIKGIGIFCQDPMLVEASNASRTKDQIFGFPPGHPLCMEAQNRTLGLAQVYPDLAAEPAPIALGRFRRLVQLRFDLRNRDQDYYVIEEIEQFDTRLTGLSDWIQQRVEAESENDEWTTDEKLEFQIVQRRFLAHFERRPAEMQMLDDGDSTS